MWVKNAQFYQTIVITRVLLLHSNNANMKSECTM